MMYLDRKLAKKLVSQEIENGEKLVEAALQLKGDEFWNTETIWKDGEFKEKRDFKCYFGSSWATPVIRFLYDDGKEKALPCYFTEEQNPDRAKKLEADEAVKLKKMLNRSI